MTSVLENVIFNGSVILILTKLIVHTNLNYIELDRKFG